MGSKVTEHSHITIPPLKNRKINNPTKSKEKKNPKKMLICCLSGLPPGLREAALCRHTALHRANTSHQLEGKRRFKFDFWLHFMLNAGTRQ